MKNEITQKIFGYIDALSAKLGIASEFIFKTLIKQEIISSIVDVFSYITAIIVIILSIKFAHKKFNEEREFNTVKTYSSDKRELWSIVFPVTLIFGSIGVIILFFATTNSITHLSNPEYYAIKTILDTVSGK